MPTAIVTTGNEMDICRKDQHAAIVAGLKGIAPVPRSWASQSCSKPYNILVNHAGYYLSTSLKSFEIIDEVGSPRVTMLYDIYHQQITEGNLIQTITNNIDKIGHFHMADVPGRHKAADRRDQLRTCSRQSRRLGPRGSSGWSSPDRLPRCGVQDDDEAGGVRLRLRVRIGARNTEDKMMGRGLIDVIGPAPLSFAAEADAPALRIVD